TNSPVTALLAQQYMEAAAALATAAVGALDTLVPCATSNPSNETGCVHDFLTAFGKRAYRRPLTDAELARFQMLFTKMRVELGYAFADGIRVVLSAILQSPHFLYHVEGATTDPTQAVTPVSGYELASRLSYFLWGTMPDDTLLAAAGSGA